MNAELKQTIGNGTSLKTLMDPQLVKDISDALPTMEGWTTHQKAFALAGYIINDNIQLAVELGIFGGKSLIPMAMAMKRKGSGVVWGVDPWTTEAALEGEHNPADSEWWGKVDMEYIYHRFVGAVFEFKVPKECRWLRCSSDDASRFFKKESIDLWHCDSNHSEEVSCREVKTWWPLIKPGAIVIMDDSQWATMQKAIGMVKSRCEMVEQVENSWMVLRKK